MMTINDDEEKQCHIQKEVGNPRKGKWCLCFMRFIQKMFRMYYVCFNYYFMPYIAVFVTFATT